MVELLRWDLKAQFSLFRLAPPARLSIDNYFFSMTNARLPNRNLSVARAPEAAEVTRLRARPSGTEAVLRSKF
jgi:hypothetical protein